MAEQSDKHTFFQRIHDDPKAIGDVAKVLVFLGIACCVGAAFLEDTRLLLATALLLPIGFPLIFYSQTITRIKSIERTIEEFKGGLESRSVNTE